MLSDQQYPSVALETLVKAFLSTGQIANVLDLVDQVDDASFEHFTPSTVVSVARYFAMNDDTEKMEQWLRRLKVLHK